MPLTRRQFNQWMSGSALLALGAMLEEMMPFNIGITGCARGALADCVQLVGVQSPIFNAGSPQAPIIDILPSTPAQEGSMSAADKAKLDAATPLALASTLALRAADGTLSGSNAIDPADFVTLTQMQSAIALGNLRVKELDAAPNVFPVKEIRVSNGTLTDLGGGVVQLITSGGPPSWLLAGNSGTNPAADWIGTNDDVDLKFKAHGLQVLILTSTVLGGIPNWLGGDVSNSIAAGLQAAFIGAGSSNAIGAGGDYAFIGGGLQNSASGLHAFVGGGTINGASGANSGVMSGHQNYANADNAAVLGGWQNGASGTESAVVSGFMCFASGSRSVTLGGAVNSAAGDNSLIYGYQCSTTEDHNILLGYDAFNNTPGFSGVFVWSDVNNFPFSPTAANEFAVRATGGARFVLGIDGGGAETVGVQMSNLGHMRIGLAGAPATSAVLDLNVTDGALLLPRLTTAQRNALTAQAGMLIYNTTTAHFEAYLGGTWQTVV